MVVVLVTNDYFEKVGINKKMNMWVHGGTAWLMVEGEGSSVNERIGLLEVGITFFT